MIEVTFDNWFGAVVGSLAICVSLIAIVLQGRNR